MTSLAASNAFQEIELSQGTVRYTDQGTGPVLVFIHGLLANRHVWSPVISHLDSHYRCLAPDLPLGAHEVPLQADVDLTPGGVAQLIADFLAALDLHDVTLIGNDTGGALCQLVIAHYPERISRLVLTNCDAYEQFFPPLVSPFHYGARLLGVQFTNLLAGLLRARWAQRLFMAVLTHHRFSQAELDAIFQPLLHHSFVRRDVTRFLRAIANHWTLEAASTFSGFHHPVLLVWGEDDPFFSKRLAVRLQQAFPDARLIHLPHAGTFLQLDQPEVFARHIMEFVPVTN